ncbi:hypothetical protein HZH66_005186 [Vespula vulgaris]|uniref:Uncharacterized protein n=1 Tax=Vespula vulgaris TaxID=7454 RepID=A0A834NCC1_VESVU|nr:hypothetical protein HZH66_005186 [Vespula vulgaris]
MRRAVPCSAATRHDQVLITSVPGALKRQSTEYTDAAASSKNNISLNRANYITRRQPVVAVAGATVTEVAKAAAIVVLVVVKVVVV